MLFVLNECPYVHMHCTFFLQRYTIQPLNIWCTNVHEHSFFKIKIWCTVRPLLQTWIFSALLMKGRWESNINLWFRFMYSQKWYCAALLFLKPNYNGLSSYFHIRVNAGIGNEAGTHFHFWEYINRIFGIMRRSLLVHVHILYMQSMHLQNGTGPCAYWTWLFTRAQI